MTVPNVIIDCLEGRTIEQKRQMVERVTEAIVQTLDCSPEAVQIIIHEIRDDQLARGGVLRLDQDN
jgi:4-oxalocrotonate tautomerase